MRGVGRVGVLGAAALLVLSCDSATGPENVGGDGVGTIVVSPSEVSLQVGASRQLTATVTDVAGRTMAGTVSWTTSPASVAAVDQNGRVEARAPGTATITASFGGKSGTATVLVVAATPAADGDIDVDARVLFQKIVGWEATAWVGNWECGTGFPTTVYNNFRGPVFDGAAELGINRLRLELRSGAERPTDLFPAFVAGTVPYEDWRATWYDAINDNADPRSMASSAFHFAELDLAIDRVVQPLRQRLEARGEKLYVNLNFIDFRRTSNFEHHQHPDEYAELIVAAFQHISSKYGWVPDAVEISLEPDNFSVQWTPQQLGQALVAAGDRLAERGWRPDFIAPSGVNMTWSLSAFDAMIAMPRVLQYMKELSYHRYSGVTTATLQAIGQRAAQHNVRTAMLEHIGSGYENLHADLKVGRNSAWQQYALAGCATGDPGGRHFLIDPSNPSAPTVRLASRSHFLRQYFKYVRAGAVRVDASSSKPALDALAFVNQGGGYVVVVKATAAQDFTVGGLPPGRYGVVYTVGPNETTPQQSGVAAADVVLAAGQALPARIPGRGVITIYAK